MRITIRTKLLAGTLFMVVLFAFLFLYAERRSRAFLRQSIGLQTAARAGEFIRRIDTAIALAVEPLQIASREVEVRDTVATSNALFDGMEDVEDYIDGREREWIAIPAGRISPFMEALIGAPLSERLRNAFVDFSEEHYGYRKFSEIIVTNRYGALAAITGRTTDYRQNDETWWTMAREEGVYIGDVEYDESAGLHGIVLAIRIDDGDGFAGVMKCLVDVKGLVREAVYLDKRYETMNFKLFTAGGKMIYSSTAFRFNEDISGKSYFRRIDGQSGFFTGEQRGKSTLFSYSKSKGYRNNPGLGWIMLVGHLESEIMSPVSALRSQIAAVLVVTLGLGVLMSFFIARSFSTPLRTIAMGADIIGSGNLDHRISLKRSDEFGRLVEAFNEMAEKRKKTIAALEVERAGLERAVEDRTREISTSYELLRREKERAESYFQLAGTIMVALNPKGDVTAINKRGCEVLEAPEEDILGKEWFGAFIQEEQRPEVRAVFDNIIAGEIEPMEYYENQVLTATGKIRTIAWHNSLIRDEKGVVLGTLSSGDDVTDSRQAERERMEFERKMQSAQKLESLGILAGGIAHDFNNLLMGMLGNVELAKLKISPTSPALEYVKNIEEVSIKAANLVNQMLAYSGKGQFVIQLVNLNTLVEDMAHLLEFSISKKARLQFALRKDIPPTRGDVAQLQQVVMNLIINASEALGDRSGLIMIRTGMVEATRDYLRQANFSEELQEGRYLFLEVSDTGCGMDADTEAKLFDPFYTTKFTGRGLGMAAVLGIVRGHHGAIRVQTEIDRGTSIFILLPVGEQVLQEKEQEEPAQESPWQGGGTILLVDDDEVVRKTATSILVELGFSVVPAVDGREAVDVFTKNAEKIDTVLLDMSMPEMDGVETYHELRRIKKEVKIILSSGFSEKEATGRFSDADSCAFIQKPYRIEQLREKLRGPPG